MPPNPTRRDELADAGLRVLAGAAGLLVLPLARAAALALAALLVVLLPANIYADRVGLAIGGRRATPLRWRLPLQLFWVGCLLWVAAAPPPLPSGGA